LGISDGGKEHFGLRMAEEMTRMVKSCQKWSRVVKRGQTVVKRREVKGEG